MRPAPTKKVKALSRSQERRLVRRPAFERASLRRGDKDLPNERRASVVKYKVDVPLVSFRINVLRDARHKGACRGGELR
jgi:hypothetical protein